MLLNDHGFFPFQGDDPEGQGVFSSRPPNHMHQLQPASDIGFNIDTMSVVFDSLKTYKKLFCDFFITEPITDLCDNF